jgi:hypothetical protein
VGLLAEFVILFFLAPTLFAYARHRVPAIPALWMILAYCLVILWHDPGFNRAVLWSTVGFRQYWPAIVVMFALALTIGIVLVLRYTPQTFCYLPRTNPPFWCTIMVLYPLVSVVPQGIVYRVFVFERYRAVFGTGWGMVLASALAFAWVHIVFRNRLAPGLTLPAGLLFAMRYWQTASLVVSSFEHALYGCAIFTIGLGQWFYYRTLRREPQAAPAVSREP